MKKNVKILLISLLILSIISITGSVSAFSVEMKLESSSKIKPGNTIEVMLKISNIDAGNGINAIGATLEYDKNVFDEVTQDSFVGVNSWSIGSYSTETQILTILRSSKVNTASDILKLTLRVKDNANVNSSTIRYKEITTSGGSPLDGGTGDIDVQEVSVTIPKDTSTNTEQPPVTNEVTTNTTTNETTTNTTTNLTTNTMQGTNTVNTNTTKTNTVKTNTNNGSASGKLPQTGENIGGIIAGVSIIAVIAIVAFIKYRNLDIK